ncbi:hypothetical protein G4G27_05425 [Sphingomonas sp. So64.6b]|uniref:hypothetical protein n=1 Tax=Sphingomonas sp. So64.6b TaxID=2997354 RepID=UPI001600AD89|nr:hypothetical protein [Sphingomonas sp. So64.6b]QNA83508.1 hypothetical protein G4G27_05425 [Sphingomonas sp. So64.6b]
MSPFELVFAVYGLLLGLAIAEVLGGFSRALKLKRGTNAVRIGWLTPLLGVLVMLDLTSFWLLAWDAREQIGANYTTLVCVLAMVGVYYLAATLIFPDAPEEWPDFDDWYDKQNRLVIGGLLAANVASWIGVVVLDAMHPLPEVAPGPMNATAELLYMVSGFSILGLFIALLTVRSRRWNVAMLVAICGFLLISGVTEPYVV